MKIFFVASLLLLVFSTAGLADVRFDTPKPTPAAPKQKKNIETNLSIMIDRDAKEARLLIPKNQLKQLRAELEQLDESDASGTTVTFNFTRTQTIVSGLFLSLAFVFGGVWFARSSRGNNKGEGKFGKKLVAGAILFLSGAFATIALANIGPPNEARSISGKLFSDAVHQYKQASGKIKLETSDSADRIVLIVPDAPSRENRSDEE
jgi:hypothetical protein